MSLNPRGDSWISEAQRDHRAIFSELDILLRSLDRFFSLENLPMSYDSLADRDFSEELKAVRDVILRVLGILEVVIPESKKNAYWFQKFAESQFLSDHSRDLFREKLYKQDTPEKAVYLLYDLFINLKGIVSDLLKTDKISYASFVTLGQVLSKEIRENVFLSPFRKDINPAFDRIENRTVSDVVRSISDGRTRRYVSLLFIYLFRMLRYLDCMDVTARDSVARHSALLILILVRSEMNMIAKYLRRAGTLRDEEMKALLISISYQFSMEVKRVYLQELKDILSRKTPNYIRGKMENGRGILKNLIEQSIVQIVQSFRPGARGNDVFESFTTRLSQALRLREDASVLLRLLALLEEKADLPDGNRKVLEAVKKFMHYFESVTFKLLRYDDYDEFAAFFDDILSLSDARSNKNLEKIHNFKIFLETTLQHISHRDELRNLPMDVGKAERVLEQYL